MYCYLGAELFTFLGVPIMGLKGHKGAGIFLAQLKYSNMKEHCHVPGHALIVEHSMSIHITNSAVI